MRHEALAPPPAPQAIAPPPASRRGWLLGVVAMWLAAVPWMIWRERGAIAHGQFPDTDDNLRLLQVRDWLAGQGWFDLRQYRLDPPAGADIHWSRLVDLPLAALIRPLTPLVGAHAAEIAAAVIVPALTLLAAMIAAATVARRAIAPDAGWWGALILLFAGPVLGMMMPLRIDHHGWQITALLTMLAGLVTPDRRRGGVVAGLAIAASLAIGVEMLPFLGLGAMLAAAGWIIDPTERERLIPFAGTLAAGIALALLLFVSPAARFGFGCDALTAAWALPILIGCAGLALAARFAPASMAGRTLALAATGAAAAVPLLLGPAKGCLLDPYHAVDPDARRLWLSLVAEALPLHRQSAEIMLATLTLPLIGLIGAGLMLWTRRADRVWLMLVLLGLASIALTWQQTRAGVAAQALAVPGAAALGWLLHRRAAASGSMLMRVGGTVGLFLLATGLAPRLAILALAAEPTPPAEAAIDKAAAACMTPAAFAALDAIPAGTMLATTDATPALVLHSHHHGIAGPYHRNGRAIADVMTAWAGDDATARPILARHHVTLVAVCGMGPEGQLYAHRAPDGLYPRLARGQAPAWLAPVPVKGTPWRVWRVVR